MEGKPNLGLDLRTPINVSLTAFYKRSFAFHTVKNRLPIIITQTVDSLTRQKEDILREYSMEAADELKKIIGELSKLKYEIQTNKPLRKIEYISSAELYNKYLAEQKVKLDQPTSFNSIWLHVECYVYCRIYEAIQQMDLLKDFDPFQNSKEESFTKSLQNITQLGIHLQKVLATQDCNKEQEFLKLLKLNLWANKCDLSLSNGIVKAESGHLDVLDILGANILSDYSLDVWDAVSAQGSSDILDIVLDNAGYELFTDLCLADFVVKNKLARTVRFYVKMMPWFVSDVMTPDFNWIIQQLKINKNSTLKKLGERWGTYVKNSAWTIEEDEFWTLPYPYKDMMRIDPDLYRKLAQAKLIIFKGDLNYRKLFGEKNWSPTTTIETALEGFHPSKLCILRTLKAEIICGLSPGVAENAEKKDSDWLIDGNFGIIQYCDKVVEL